MLPFYIQKILTSFSPATEDTDWIQDIVSSFWKDGRMFNLEIALKIIEKWPSVGTTFSRDQWILKEIRSLM